MKNVAMNIIMTKPTRPTIVNTKPEATLFCKKDVLEPGLVVGRGNGVESTKTVVTVEGTEELEMLSVEEVEEGVEYVEVIEKVDEETMEGETLLDELDLSDQFSTSQPQIIISQGHTMQKVMKLSFVIWGIVQKLRFGRIEGNRVLTR